MSTCYFPIHQSRLIPPRPVRMDADKVLGGIYLALIDEGIERWTCKACWKRAFSHLPLPFIPRPSHTWDVFSAHRTPAMWHLCSIHPPFSNLAHGHRLWFERTDPPGFPIDVSQWNPNRRPFQLERLIGGLETTVATAPVSPLFFSGTIRTRWVPRNRIASIVLPPDRDLERKISIHLPSRSRWVSFDNLAKIAMMANQGIDSGRSNLEVWGRETSQHVEARTQVQAFERPWRTNGTY